MKLYTFNIPFADRWYPSLGDSMELSTMEPGLSDYAFEAFERMTDGGCNLEYLVQQLAFRKAIAEYDAAKGGR